MYEGCMKPYRVSFKMHFNKLSVMGLITTTLKLFKNHIYF